MLITMAFAGVAGTFATLVVRTVWLPDYRPSLRPAPIWDTSRTRATDSSPRGTTL
ncbi:hypothetical protein [Nocardia vaccinii]|uniref:hypothetical protein n=1 Tax=Nocardia vaccinii TaxID=1822 RepID=UPI00147183A4|nr:hypothetical protein [Nocardia vaccinii]